MSIKYIAIALAAGVAVVSLAAPERLAAPQKSAPPLLTEDQEQADKAALALLRSPAVQAAREYGLKLWASSPGAKLEDGQSQLEGALDEAVFAALRSVAAGDPSNPKVLWIEAPAYSWGGINVPGSRVAGDSPDRIYRIAALDTAYRYEIRGRRHAQPSHEEFSFEAHANGQPRAVLNSKDVDVRPDGSFTITADSTPANGRRNHLTLPAGTTSVLIRDTLIDWSKQLPNRLEIKRIDGPEPAARTLDAVSRQAAEAAARLIELNLKYVDAAWKSPANVIKAQIRKLEDGVPGAAIAFSRFSLKSDEALVVTVDPNGAKYVGFQLTDLWLRSIPYWNAISSLSNLQAKPNADGSLTYVLALKDPGYHNWLSTGGLRDGLLLVRAESFTAQPAPDKIVREAKVVKLSDLPAALPKDAALAAPEVRERQLAERSAEYEKRVAR
jgi:hypothetical protein